MSEDFSQSVAVVWHAAWPIGVLDAHCTVMYLGELDKVEGLAEKRDQVISALKALDFSDVALYSPHPIGTEMFGPEKDIPVVLLGANALHMARGFVEDALDAIGVENGSAYKDYRPHITVPDTSYFNDLPDYIELFNFSLWWGNERYTL